MQQKIQYQRCSQKSGAAVIVGISKTAQTCFGQGAFRYDSTLYNPGFTPTGSSGGIGKIV